MQGEEKGKAGDGKKKRGERGWIEVEEIEADIKIKVEKRLQKRLQPVPSWLSMNFFGSQHGTKNIWNGPFNSTVLHSQPIPPFAYFISDEDGWWKSMSLRWAFYQGYAILQTPKTSLSHLCCRNINLSTQSLYSRGRSNVNLSAGISMTGF